VDFANGLYLLAESGKFISPLTMQICRLGLVNVDGNGIENRPTVELGEWLELTVETLDHEPGKIKYRQITGQPGWTLI